MTESPDEPGRDDLSALYAGHYKQLLRLAVLLVGDLAGAEEVVQEAFIRIHRALGRRPVDCPLAYLRQTVVDLARPGLRRRLIRRHAPPPVPDEVVRALRRIPARQREAVVLRFWADLPEAEIAELMGVSIGAVKSYLSRAMGRLGLLLQSSR